MNASIAENRIKTLEKEKEEAENKLSALALKIKDLAATGKKITPAEGQRLKKQRQLLSQTISDTGKRLITQQLRLQKSQQDVAAASSQLNVAGLVQKVNESGQITVQNEPNKNVTFSAIDKGDPSFLPPVAFPGASGQGGPI